MSPLLIFQGLIVISLVTAWVLYRKGVFGGYTGAAPGMAERTVSSRKGRIAYLEGGDGKTAVVILHGFADAKEDWVPLAQKLTSRGIRVLVPDLPGFGKSYGNDSFEATKLAASIRQLARDADLEIFHLVGHSTGALVAAAYAYGFPTEIASLTLVEPFGIRVPYESDLDKALAAGRNPLLLSAPSGYDALLRFATARPPELRAPDKAARGAALVENRAALQEAWQELREGKRANLLDLLLPAIEVRTRVVLGGRSRVVHPKTSEALPILNPDIDVVVLPDAGHWPMVENPEALSEAIVGAPAGR